jgi:hypothetical protein
MRISPSAALIAALAEIDAVFDGCTSPHEAGCTFCHLPCEIALLRTPRTQLPDGLLFSFMHKEPGHFTDHDAVLRRLLPQAARAMVDGSMPTMYGHGLTRTKWRAWPREQAAAIDAFLDAWWCHTLTDPAPPTAVHDIFDACVTIAGTVGPFLSSWEATGEVADRHLVACASFWFEELAEDASPFHLWTDPGQEAIAADELRRWIALDAPRRLRALGEPGLAKGSELLGLPYDERWSQGACHGPSLGLIGRSTRTDGAVPLRSSTPADTPQRMGGSTLIRGGSDHGSVITA